MDEQKIIKKTGVMMWKKEGRKNDKKKLGHEREKDVSI